MISSNPTGLVETISQGPKTGFPRGQACLSVSVCTLGPHLSRRKDFILITCVHRERLCVCNGGEQPAVPCLSPQHLISQSENLGCCGEGEMGGGHSGPSTMDTPSPRASPCAVAEDREVRESHWAFSASEENSQHHLHLLFFARVNNIPRPNARELVVFSFPSKKKENQL